MPQVKQSKPVCLEPGVWRIRRHDGVLVGYYATKALAEHAIARQPWLL